jgi:hypothetical protein
MKERPILFSGPMVRAILDGRKSQTRRVVKPQPPPECSIHYPLGNESWLPACERTALRHTWEAWGGALYESRPKHYLCGIRTVACPYGAPGDRLWVRETWASFGDSASITPPVPHQCQIRYHADNVCEWRDVPQGSRGLYPDASFRLRPSIYMPRWASRITLEITGVRVERLNAITAGDAEQEGVDARECCRVEAFERLWDSINAKRGYGWAVNPWVWVIKFKRIGGAA